MLKIDLAMMGIDWNDKTTAASDHAKGMGRTKSLSK